MPRKKIALIGAGAIGGTLAHLAALKDLGTWFSTTSSRESRRASRSTCWPPGRSTATTPASLARNDYEPHRNADVVIVTAGLPRKPGMSRDELVGVNTGIMKGIAEKVRELSPNAFVIVITNPLDAMVYVMKKVTGFPKNRVVGMAGVLDSARFRTFVAMELGISVEDVTGDGPRRPRRRHGADRALLHRRRVSDREVPLQGEDRGHRQAHQMAGGEVVNLLKTSAWVSPASAGDRDGGVLSQGQEACPALRGLTSRASTGSTATTSECP